MTTQDRKGFTMTTNEPKCMGGDCRPDWNWRRTDCPRHGDEAPTGLQTFERDRAGAQASLSDEDRHFESALRTERP